MKEEHTCETCNLVYAYHQGKRRCALDDCEVYLDGSCAEWEEIEKPAVQVGRNSITSRCKDGEMTWSVSDAGDIGVEWTTKAPYSEIMEIADHYSLTNQLHQTNEELAELIQAICKLERKYPEISEVTAEIRMSDEYVHLEEEFADVAVMMEQLQYKLDFGSVIHDLMLAKTGRQCRRIEEGTE